MSRMMLFLLVAVLSGCSAGSDSQQFDPAAGAGGQPSNPSDAGDDSLAPLDAGSVPTDAPVCTDAIDIVFVLDVSSSMDFVLSKLGTEIDAVVNAANALAAQSGAKQSQFGLIAFVDNHVLDLGGPLEGGRVHTDPQSLRNAFKFYLDFFTGPNRNPGDGTSGPTMQNPICEENALDAIYAAAEEFPWRPNATRLLIVATDDTFLERPDNYGDRDGDGKTDKTNFPSEGDYPALRTAAETIDALKAQKIRVFSFTARANAAHLCGTGRRLPKEARVAGWTANYWDTPPIPASTAGADFDLAQVRSGAISLSTTINDVVVSSYCNPPIY